MLYHGSKTSGIKTLNPRPHNGVDGDLVVFATPDIRFALAMIYGTGDELAVGYHIDQETHKEEMYIDELTPNALELLGKPGTVYEVKNTGFTTDNRLTHIELISKKDTPVISEKNFDNVLEELRKYKDIKFVKYDDVLDEMKKRGKTPEKAEIEYKEDRFN